MVQVQRALQEADPGMGGEPVELIGDHRELDDGPEPLGLPRGCLCWWGHRKAASAGGQALLQHRQVVAAHHAESQGDPERRPVLCRR